MSDTDLNIIAQKVCDILQPVIEEAVRYDREKVVKDFCKRIGFDLESNDDFISKNKASKILKRSKVEKYMLNGIIPKGTGWYADGEGRWDRIWINRSLVMKLKNKNKF